MTRLGGWSLLALVVLFGSAGCPEEGNGGCADDCSAGASRCDGDVVERCTEVNGCLMWVGETHCGEVGQGTCDATGGEAACTGTCAGDADCDGVPTASDCDDTDVTVGSNAGDADCDGIPTASDCDDTDAAVGSNAGDADCDGVPTADDCDDTDAALGAKADDADCDGVPTASDCDDADASLGSRDGDADCDGVRTADDCDDTDASLGSKADDADCDGVASADDCDDADPALGDRAGDADCDGALTALDCDDQDPAVTWDAADADCDGAPDVVVFEKIDDADPTDPANQDCITSNVCITRDASAGLFNAVSETSYSSGSPADVAFAEGYVGEGLTFSPWRDAIRNPTWWVGQRMALHLVTDDLYYDVVDFRWTAAGNGGGFAWARADVKAFQKADLADPTDPANQDCLVPGVCLTRGDTKSLYNAVTETGYAGISPAGTEWAPTATRDAAPDAYGTFADATGGAPQDMIGRPMSVHVTGTHVYYDVVITAWSGGGAGGGFAWERSRALVVGCPDPTAANYDPRTTVDDGFCGDWVRVEIPSDPDVTDPANYDCITPEVCITRGVDKGLYNAAQEDGYDRANDSPLGTLWAPSATADAATADFGSWRDAVHGNPPASTNRTLSLWLPAASRLFDVVVVRWPGDGSGGGVTYLRREVPWAAACGNGVLEVGEYCDEGSANSEAPDATCRTDCNPAGCGDGVVDTGEGCDEGSANSDAPNATCRTDCRPAGCGDGILDSGEVCDDGNLTNGDGCEDTCDIGCGLGTEAFRGATRDADGACLLAFDLPVSWPRAEVLCEAVDGNLATVLGGADNDLIAHFGPTGDYAAWIGLNDQATEGAFEWVSGAPVSYTHWRNGEPSNSNGNEDCTEIGTWDYHWNDAPCDTGRPYVCETLCGNGVLDPGEECDAGEANSDAAGSSCRNNCRTTAVCGDGILDDGEQCDDGNTADGDGCQSDCTLVCGAGLGAAAAVESPSGAGCFALYEAPLTWSDAEAACVSHGGHLASLGDAADNDALLPLRQRTGNLWLGYTDAANEGTFEWVDGTAGTYTHWNPGEPNNSGDEDCTAYLGDGRWNDEPCAGLRSYVCEL